MKRKNFGPAMNALDSVSELKGVKFAFTVLKNRKKLEAQLEEDKSIFETILTPSEGFKEYEQKRLSLCEVHSEKDEEGKALTEGDRYKIIDLNVFNLELSELSEEYKASIDDRKNQIDEYNSLMEEDMVIEFQTLTFTDLPEDLTESQLRSLEFMLNLD
jgi:hypothetical protein